jgi:hypothetical protein
LRGSYHSYFCLKYYSLCISNTWDAFFQIPAESFTSLFSNFPSKIFTRFPIFRPLNLVFLRQTWTSRRIPKFRFASHVSSSKFF